MEVSNFKSKIQNSKDVHEISSRLKNIVNNILLLQKSGSTQKLPTCEVNLREMLNNILTRETANKPRNLVLEPAFAFAV